MTKDNFEAVKPIIKVLKRPKSRTERQLLVAEWCVAAFGEDHMHNIEQRALRFLEEAIETAQVCGCDPEMIHKLVDYVYGRPVGDLKRELGGAGITLLALAHSAGYIADECEQRELERVVSLPLENFSKRNQEKNDAGFIARSASGDGQKSI